MKKTFLFFAALFAALVSFTLTSCDGNDPEEGVIILKMRNADNGGTSISCKVGDNSIGYVSINDANNFVCTTYYGNIELVDAGAKKLGAVTKVPSSGWTYELAVVPGHTYVIKCQERYWDQDRYKDGETAYYKIYVIDWINGASSGGIIGAEVKYCEWEPNN